MIWNHTLLHLSSYEVKRIGENVKVRLLAFVDILLPLTDNRLLQ